ncbi:MAG TPA: phage holin family protein [Bryobacteraceae bacterium]|nr:phage holin family protein [Bryobacteraceae bacterium]
MHILIRWAITAVSLVVAAWVVPGIHVASNAFVAFGVMAIVLGLVNAIVRPILKLLTCPAILLTLGLFVFVINGFTLWLASAIAVNFFHVGFYVNGFVPAFFGALMVSIVSVVLHALVREAEG